MLSFLRDHRCHPLGKDRNLVMTNLDPRVDGDDTAKKSISTGWFYWFSPLANVSTIEKYLLIPYPLMTNAQVDYTCHSRENEAPEVVLICNNSIKNNKKGHKCHPLKSSPNITSIYYYYCTADLIISRPASATLVSTNRR